MNATRTRAAIMSMVLAILVADSARADFFFAHPTNLGAPINQGPHYSSSGQGEVDPTISEDELTLYFASSRPGGLGNGDLWLVTRPTKQDPWSEPVNLGPKVNSSSGDWAPKLSPDGLSLYFHSNRAGGKGGSDIWMTTRSALDAPWQDAVNLGEPINTSAGEQDPSVSPDGLTLYFDRGQTELFEARRSSTSISWEQAEVGSSSLNSPGNDCHPHISPDGLSIYFCSTRAGGYGAMDIYVATRTSLQSPWGEPANLGDVINTPYGNYAPCISADGLTLYYDESNGIRMAMRASLAEPFVDPIGLTSHDMRAQLSADGLEMYFSSDRPGGWGYQDIWVAVRESPEEPWQEPVNLGPGINSNDWDWAPCLSLDGLELYFTSEHDCNAGDWDLWVSTRATTDDPWGPAVNLGPVVNRGSADGDPAISADKLTLIFSSERSGGKGLADLWMTRRSAVTEPWGKPVPLGEKVNTANYEAGPCLSPDGRWLFFTSVTSNSPSTYNYIMLSALGPDGQWGPPRNLARETTLPSNAGYPTLAPDGHTLYFQSDVPEGVGGADIWSLDVRPILDLNGDGWVDEFDTALVEQYLGQERPSCDIAPSPFGDGIVDAEDLTVFLAHLGLTVDEPALLAHWTLDETAGSTAHDSAGDRDGTLHGGPLWQPSGGILGGALLFDGVNDYVKTRFVCNPAVPPYSIFAWIKGGAPGGVILSQAEGTNWLRLLGEPGLMTLVTELKPPSGGKVLSSPVPISDGDWHRIGLVRDGTNRVLYVDDIEVAADTQTLWPGSLNGLYLGTGSRLTAETFFSGLIDEVRVYKRAVRP